MNRHPVTNPGEDIPFPPYKPWTSVYFQSHWSHSFVHIPLYGTVDNSYFWLLDTIYHVLWRMLQLRNGVKKKDKPRHLLDTDCDTEDSVTKFFHQIFLDFFFLTTFYWHFCVFAVGTSLFFVLCASFSKHRYHLNGQKVQSEKKPTYVQMHCFCVFRICFKTAHLNSGHWAQESGKAGIHMNISNIYLHELYITHLQAGIMWSTFLSAPTSPGNRAVLGDSWTGVNKLVEPCVWSLISVSSSEAEFNSLPVC